MQTDVVEVSHWPIVLVICPSKSSYIVSAIECAVACKFLLLYILFDSIIFCTAEHI